MFSILHRGHVLQPLFPKPSDGGRTSHPQCLCTASCLCCPGGEEGMSSHPQCLCTASCCSIAWAGRRGTPHPQCLCTASCCSIAWAERGGCRTYSVSALLLVAVLLGQRGGMSHLQCLCTASYLCCRWMRSLASRHAASSACPSRTPTAPSSASRNLSTNWTAPPSARTTRISSRSVPHCIQGVISVNRQSNVSPCTSVLNVTLRGSQMLTGLS